MVVLLVALGCVTLGFALFASGIAGASLTGVACFLGILARIAQAYNREKEDDHHWEVICKKLDSMLVVQKGTTEIGHSPTEGE